MADSNRIIFAFVLLFQTEAFSPPFLPPCPAAKPTTWLITSLPKSSERIEDANSDGREDEKNFITTALLKNSLFSGISETSLKDLVDGFKMKAAKRGETIITQGDSCVGDYVYLVSEGTCKVIIDGNIVPEPGGSVTPGNIFGELSLLYDKPRAATIRARSDTVDYYRLPGELFKQIMTKPKEELKNMQAIDEAINQISGTDALFGGDIIMPYRPERFWLWQQFSGTVFKISLGPTLANIVLCVAFVVFARHCTGDPLWAVGVGEPDLSLPFVHKLHLVGKIWDIDKTLTTFVLTFFVNQSFSFWNKVYQLARDVQGRLNDFNLLIATNVKRNEDGMLMPESRKLINDISCYSRLFHIFMWASKAKRFSDLVTPDGLKRMESRGLIRSKQVKVLQSSKLPENKLYDAPLEWMMIRSNQAMDEGILAGDTSTKGMLLKQIVGVRGAQRAITDKIDGRMPLAYVNLVQVLVDSFVFTAPIALYSRLGDFSIIAVGILTIFYTGLNNLAKIFLDPLNNENFSSNSIFMDLGVFLRETNGQSVQWKKAGNELPF